MIFVFHDRKKVTKIFDFNTSQEIEANGKTIQETLYNLSSTTKGFVGWCHHELEDFLNYNAVKNVFHHDLIMASYSTKKKYIIPPEIGYVESTTAFLKINHSVLYPTWLMSSDVGGINSKVLVKFKDLSEQNFSFDIFLNTISRMSISKGLICYSDPNLLKEDAITISQEHKKINLFTFVKNNYRGRWLSILLLDYFLYQKKVKLGAFIKSIFTPKLNYGTIDFNDIEVKSILKRKSDAKDYDVLIPTLGRASYLEDVLKDLAEQTMLPSKVIVIEQNAIEAAKTELDYVYDKKWPFKIDHVLIHQLGACNARNMALSKVTTSWVFFADDDIRIQNNLIEKAFAFMDQYGLDAITMASLMKNETLNNTIPIQWATFSTNSSLVKQTAIKNVWFGMEHEFGFGEDSDFGMKIRNAGSDVIFYPNKDILHLKAPSGGFRVKITHPWDDDKITPKPSPTVMAHKLKHVTKAQLLGYRSTLFLKFFKVQNNKNPFSYYASMSKKWKKSIYWAQSLINKHNTDGV